MNGREGRLINAQTRKSEPESRYLRGRDCRPQRPHELVRLGYAVQVYEANGDAGGFFRSARLPQDGKTPSEYSWHGMGPWYHNTFDLMKQVP
jgi:hypothetical protein